MTKGKKKKNRVETCNNTINASNHSNSGNRKAPLIRQGAPLGVKGSSVQGHTYIGRKASKEAGKEARKTAPRGAVMDAEQSGAHQAPAAGLEAVPVKSQQGNSRPSQPAGPQQLSEGKRNRYPSSSSDGSAQHQHKKARGTAWQVPSASVAAANSPGTHPSGDAVPSINTALPAQIAMPSRSTSAAAVGANWEALKKVIGATGEGKRHNKDHDISGRRPGSIGKNAGLTSVVALDCEMVGVGPRGECSEVAQVCIVNEDGHVLLNTYVTPREKVTDYRTKISGVERHHLVGAPPFETVQQQVADIITGRLLVGHSLDHDLKCLLLSHPKKMTRDTARYPPLMRRTEPGRRGRPRALRHLVKEELGLVIQEGQHSPVDDARAALYLYQKHKKEWEKAIRQGRVHKLPVGKEGPAGAMMKKRKTATNFSNLTVSDDPMADL